MQTLLSPGLQQGCMQVQTTGGAYLRYQCSYRRGRTCPSALWKGLAAQTCLHRPRSLPQTALPPAKAGRLAKISAYCAAEKVAVQSNANVSGCAGSNLHSHPRSAFQQYLLLLPRTKCMYIPMYANSYTHHIRVYTYCTIYASVEMGSTGKQGATGCCNRGGFVFLSMHSIPS